MRGVRICYCWLFIFMGSPLGAVTPITLPPATTPTAPAIFTLLGDFFSHGLFFRPRRLGFCADFLFPWWP
jgi:hypothetical protein